MKKAVCIISALCAAAALLCSCGGTKLEKTDMDIASDTYKPSCAEPESAAIYDGILYTACTDKVLSYDIENDEEKVLLDGLTDCRLIAAGDGEVWIYESGGKMLMCFGVDGAEKRSYPLESNQENTGFYDLTVPSFQNGHFHKISDCRKFIRHTVIVYPALQPGGSFSIF